MLSAGRIRMGCLLMGILILGGGVVRVSGCASRNAEETEMECLTEDSLESWMKEKYQSLEEEEIRLQEALQEIEESLLDEAEEGWTRAEELREELRHICVQKQVLKARIEEMAGEEEGEEE